MKIPPFKMEEWLSGYRFSADYNLAESGMRDLTLHELLNRCGSDIHILENLLMEDMPTNGSEYLRESIACTYRAVAPDNILVTTGTGEALFVFFNTILNSGDRVVASMPSFQALYEIPRAIGAKIAFYEHRIEEGYQFQADRFINLITEDTKLVIVNTPHNPTGVECDPETMETIIQQARDVGAKVLFDEHYRFLPHDDRAEISSGVEFGPDIFATGSITKCFGAMGLRVGWLVGPRDILDECRAYRDYLTHTLSPISEKLTALALENRSKILAESKAILNSNKAMLSEWMESHSSHFDYIPPKAGVVCYPRYREPIPSRDWVARMIEKAGVFCLPAHSFEQENYIRIGLGSRPEQFSEALASMDRVLNQT